MLVVLRIGELGLVLPSRIVPLLDDLPSASAFVQTCHEVHHRILHPVVARYNYFPVVAWPSCLGGQVFLKELGVDKALSHHPKAEDVSLVEHSRILLCDFCFPFCGDRWVIVEREVMVTVAFDRFVFPAVNVLFVNPMRRCFRIERPKHSAVP